MQSQLLTGALPQLSALQKARADFAQVAEFYVKMPSWEDFWQAVGYVGWELQIPVVNFPDCSTG